MSYPTYQQYTPPETTNISTEHGGYKVVCPWPGSMAADASADIQAILQETATIAGVHYSYNATQLTRAQSCTLLNSFTVSGRGPTDPSGAFDVQVTDPSGFRSIILAALEDRKSAINNNMETNIESQIRVWIQDDNLINSVENSFADAHCMIDSSSGASSMREIFISSNNPAKLFYTQISATNLNLYMDPSEEPITNALPLKQGDSLVFAWDVLPTVGSFHYFQTDVTGSDGSPATPAGYSSSKTIIGTATRHAVIIQLSGTGMDAGQKFPVYGDEGSSAGQRLKGPAGQA